MTGEWHPRDELSCAAELDRLDEEYARLKTEFEVACEANGQGAHELSRGLQTLRRTMFELEEREFETLVTSRPPHLAAGQRDPLPVLER